MKDSSICSCASIAYNFTPLKQTHAGTAAGALQVEVVQPTPFALTTFRFHAEPELGDRDRASAGYAYDDSAGNKVIGGTGRVIYNGKLRVVRS